MIAGQIAIREGTSAIQADIQIPAEQGFVGEGWYTTRRMHHLAFAGDDGMNVEMRLAAVYPRMPTTDPQDRVTQGPDDDLPGIQAHGFLPADPVYGLAGDIEPQYARHAIKICNDRNHDSPSQSRRYHEQSAVRIQCATHGLQDNCLQDNCLSIGSAFRTSNTHHDFDYSRRDGHSAPMLIRTLLVAALFVCLVLGGCSSRQSKSVQYIRNSDLWMCQADATREDWDCVQDSARARAIEEKRAAAPASEQ